MLHGIEGLRTALGDRYSVERELGQGGMATVYLAEDLKHGRKVAIKILKPELAAAVGTERFLREIAISAKLRHPHILPLYDSGGAEALLYYVMPFVEGETLRSRLDRETQLPVENALEIARQVADALSYAHARGVIHRDIKPANILLESGHAMVADFGIARAITAARGEGLTETGMTVGTPAYLSPEQAAGERNLDGRSDVYALGCVLYEMLAGQPPFTGPTAASVVHQRLIAEPPLVTQLRPGVPAGIANALKRTLAMNPADRFTAMELGAALGGIGTGKDSASAALWQRNRGLTALGLMLAVVAVAAVTLRVRQGPLPTATTIQPTAVAVLDFDNLSRDSADAYLAEGLAEELTSRLGELKRLRVKSRLAVRRAVRSAGEVVTMARALGVGYVVEGSVRRSGGRVRVSVRLVNADDGFRVWGEDYDRATNDLLALQEQIASDVAAKVAGQLLPEEQASLAAQPTQNAEAFARFLRGNYFLAQRNAQSVARAIQEYEAASQLDTLFTRALARSAYAFALFLDWGWDYPGISADSQLVRGLAASDLALQRDPTESEAWMARGLLLSHRNPDTFDGVLDAFRRAIALDPRNAEALHQYAWILLQVGEDSAAVTAYHRALALEPDRPSTLRELGLQSLIRGRNAEAQRWLDSSLRVDPGFYSAYGLRALGHLRSGDTAGARADAETSLRLRPDDPLRGEYVLAIVDDRSGDTASFGKRIRRLRAAVNPGQPGVWDSWYLAIALAGAGRADAAVDVLERARPRGVTLRFALRVPEFDRLRTDPRFRRLMQTSPPRRTAG